MISLNDVERNCKDHKCLRKKCPFPCANCYDRHCNQCIYSYKSVVERIKEYADDLEEYSHCEYVQLILKEKKNEDVEMKEKETFKEEVQNKTDELETELKRYRKKLEIKAVQSFFETMFRGGIDLFKVDRVMIACTSRRYEANVKIDIFKEEILIKREKLFFWEEVEFIESLYNYKEVIEKELGAKIDFKEKKLEDFEMLYTWEIDCTGIK